MKKEDLKDEVIQGEVVIEEVEKTDEEKEIENLLNLEKPAILEENYKVVRKQSSEVKALVKEIDVTNAGTILNFGAKPAEELSQISNEILRTSKNVENIEATAIIKNLTKLIKKVDISDFEKAPKKETGILSIFSKVFNSGKNLIAKYENMNKEIEVIAKELLQYKVDIEKDQNDLKSLSFCNFPIFIIFIYIHCIFYII